MRYELYSIEHPSYSEIHYDVWDTELNSASLNSACCVPFRLNDTTHEIGLIEVMESSLIDLWAYATPSAKVLKVGEFDFLDMDHLRTTFPEYCI